MCLGALTAGGVTPMKDGLMLALKEIAEHGKYCARGEETSLKSYRRFIGFRFELIKGERNGCRKPTVDLDHLRQREKQTNRQTDGRTDGRTDRQTNMQTERQRDRHTNMHTDR